MNISKNHPTFTTCNDVDEIAKSLKPVGINYFDYTRNYYDGGRVWLASNPSPTERYLFKKYYLHGNMEGFPQHYKPQIVFLDTLPKQFIYDDVLRAHHLDHAMQIISPKENYCEFFTFATAKNNIGIINTYLTKLDEFKKFCDLFTEQAAEIINLVEKQKFFLPYHDKPFDLCKENISEGSKFMSKRQLECAKLLIAGKTIREIASYLHLSPRTIEHYLDHIKIKLNCKNKTELIIALTKII